MPVILTLVGDQPSIGISTLASRRRTDKPLGDVWIIRIDNISARRSGNILNGVLNTAKSSSVSAANIAAPPLISVTPLGWVTRDEVPTTQALLISIFATGISKSPLPGKVHDNSAYSVEQSPSLWLDEVSTLVARFSSMRVRVSSATPSPCVVPELFAGSGEENRQPRLQQSRRPALPLQASSALLALSVEKLSSDFASSMLTAPSLAISS